MDVEVLPEAVAALESSYLQPWTRQRIRNFVHDHLGPRKSQAPLWTLSEALRMDKLYRHIQTFMVAFASEALETTNGLVELDSILKYPLCLMKHIVSSVPFTDLIYSVGDILR